LLLKKYKLEEYRTKTLLHLFFILNKEKHLHCAARRSRSRRRKRRELHEYVWM